MGVPQCHVEELVGPPLVIYRDAASKAMRVVRCGTFPCDNGEGTRRFNLVDPEEIVLGGGLVESLPKLYLEEVAGELKQRVMPAFGKSFVLKTAELGDDAGYGAGAGVSISRLENGQLLPGPLRFGTYRFRSRRVYTNKPCCGPKRGHGSVQPRFPLETAIDEVGLLQAIGADLDLRDRTLPLFQAELDEFAHTMADRFSAQGLTLFTDPTGTVPAHLGAKPQSGYVGFAATIQVNPTITATPSLIRDGTTTITDDPGGASGFTTIELKANYLGAAKLGEAVACEARLLHGGRMTQVWDAEATNETTGKLMAVFRCTQMVLYPR